MRSTTRTARAALQIAALLVILTAGLTGCHTAATTPALSEAKARAAADDADLLAGALKLIEPFEGRRHRVYDDGLGNLTIGVGFNLDRGNAEQTLAQLLPGVSYADLRAGRVQLTDAQIDTLLRHDARQALAAARQYVANFDELPKDAQLIVIDMSFNLGSISQWPGLRAALADADFAAAADAMLDSRWSEQTGQRAEHLINVMRSLANAEG